MEFVARLTDEQVEILRLLIAGGLKKAPSTQQVAAFMGIRKTLLDQAMTAVHLADEARVAAAEASDGR